jgi:hypothetical protein
LGRAVVLVAFEALVESKFFSCWPAHRVNREQATSSSAPSPLYCCSTVVDVVV